MKTRPQSIPVCQVCCETHWKRNFIATPYGFSGQLHLGARRQVARERDVERHRGVDPDVVDPVLAAAALDLPGEALELLEVRLADGARVGRDLAERFQTMELGHLLER